MIEWRPSRSSGCILHRDSTNGDSNLGVGADRSKIGHMDYTLIALIGVMALTMVVSHRYHSRTWSGRPGYQYQRVISVGVMGLSLTIAGAIGWDVSHAHGLLQGMKWVDGPIWWQIGLGGVLLALAVFFARTVPSHATRSPIIH
jgi:hypothetical protein